MTAIITGYNPEIFQISRRQGVEVVGIVEPNNTLNLPNGIAIFRADEIAVKTTEFQFVINAIDNVSIRETVDKFYTDNSKSPLSLLAGEICNSSSHEDGLIMQTNSVISSNCKLGRCVKINTSATVTHDVKVSDYVVIAPGAVVLGHVTIGKSAYIGANSTILPEVDIGEAAVVGAGSVVRENVEPFSTVVGVPARVISRGSK